MAIFDAAVGGGGGYGDFGYLFRGTHYYKYRWLEPLGVVAGYPLPINGNWNLPDPEWRTGIDAAVNGGGIYAGHALLFRGNRFQVYRWDDVPVNQPDEIRRLGVMEPFASGIDAAVTGQGQYAGKALLFRGNQVGVLDWNTSVFSLLPWESLNFPSSFAGGIDGAFTGRHSRSHYAYFFKDNQYIRYDWSHMAVTPANPPYPDTINRMNSGAPWPGLELSQPVVTDKNKLRIRVIFAGGGVNLPIPDFPVGLSTVGCHILSGRPYHWFTTASNAGLLGDAYIDTNEIDLGDVGPDKAYRFKNLHADVLRVKIEPHSAVFFGGGATVTLTIIPPSGVSGPNDQISFVAPNISGGGVVIGPIEFTAEFFVHS